MDLVAEDRGFAEQMERMFEKDLASAREIRLARSGRGRVEVRPGRPLDTGDRAARRGTVEALPG